MVQSVTDPGTISVPMSTIVDALKNVLKGVLTAEEESALFDQLGLSPGVVSPGDLITADLFNRMLSDINGLSIRLAALEGAAGGPVLESLDPPNKIAVNSLFVVTGRNFNPEPKLNVVKIGDIDITQYREESSETHLIFPIPDLFSGLPKTLPVRVETGGRTSNVMQITIEEEDKVQKGSFFFGAGQPAPAKVNVGDDLSITWQVTPSTTLPDNVALALQVSNIVGASQSVWLTKLAFQPTAPMAMVPGVGKAVTAKVKVPAGATSASFSLKVTSADGNVSNVSDTVDVTVGQNIPVSSDKNTITVSKVGSGLTEGKVTIDNVQGDGVLVKKAAAPGSVKITVTDARKQADGNSTVNYAFKAEFVAPVTGLAINPDFTPKVANNVPFNDDRTFFVPLDAGAAAVGATAQLKVTATQTSTTDVQKVFTSWLVIPLKIVS